MGLLENSTIEGESLFDVVVPSLLRPANRSAWTGTRMDAAENDKSYQLAIELPGIPKDSIQVSVYENTVTITGEAAAPVLYLTLQKKRASQVKRLTVH